MKTALIFFCGLLWALTLAVPPACAWTHELSTPPAATTCNINTGVATGSDAGTCASPHATCNGVADDAAAFVAFNTWARSTIANSGSQLIELAVSGTCMFNTGFTVIWKGVKNGRLMGYGATLSDGGGFYNLGTSGICQKGLAEPAGCSARVATASLGATSVTLLNTSLCSRFVAGRWAVVTGFDLQGIFNAPFGYPPNPNYFDYVQINSTSNCASTGQITFNSALTNTYLSTWPNFNAGNANEADAGGPGTIYALDATWDIELDIRGVTIDQPTIQTGINGRSISLRDVTVTGTNCIIPSQNSSMSVVNATMTNCQIEVDKIVGTYLLSNATVAQVIFQSSSVNNFVASNSIFTAGLVGTPKVATISNSTIRTLRLGPTGYGAALSATCTNCKITTAIGNGTGLLFKGPNDQGANFYYSMSGGVLSAPDTASVIGFANNGSGTVRVTVASTTGWVSGTYIVAAGVFSSGPNADGTYTVIVVDRTHIDLQGTTFGGSVWTGGGSLNNSAPPWAVPGTNLFFAGQLEAQASAFQVSGVTQDSSGTHVATSLVGEFPTLPLINGKLFFQVQMPKFTCSGCTGIADAVDLAGAPPNIPVFSYSNRTYTNSTTLVSHKLWGKVTSIKFNVTQAYIGSINPLKFEMNENTVISPGTTSFYDAFIDLRTAGLRTITPSGVTCDTGGAPVAGGCGADRGLTLPDPTAFFAADVLLFKNASPTDQPWQMSIEFVMDQGVVP